MEKLIAYTDGGCSGNPGPGGWSFIIKREKGEIKRWGGEERTTNNRMELSAVINLLKEIYSQIPDNRNIDIEICTDSQYVKKGITEWIVTWEKNGWKNAAKKPVKNKDLWVQLRELSRPLQIQWKWVRGHAGNIYNEECDSLVKTAMREFM